MRTRTSTMNHQPYAISHQRSAIDRAALTIRGAAMIRGAATLRGDLIDRRHPHARQIVVVDLRAVAILERAVVVVVVQRRSFLLGAVDADFPADERLEHVLVAGNPVRLCSLTPLFRADRVARSGRRGSAGPDAGARVVHLGEDVFASEVALLQAAGHGDG